MLLALLRTGGISVCRLGLKNKAAPSLRVMMFTLGTGKGRGKGRAGLPNPKSQSWQLNRSVQAQHCRHRVCISPPVPTLTYQHCLCRVNVSKTPGSWLEHFIMANHL